MANDSVDVTVAELSKNSRENLRGGLQTFKNYKLLSIRSWTKPDEGKVAIPTKNGLSVQVHLIPQLRAALDEAESKAREIGWLS